jgi:hypothetical protein
LRYRSLARFRVDSVIDASAQFLAGTEEGHRFRLNTYGLTCAGIATFAGLTMPYGKRAKPAKFHSIAARKSVANLI